MSYVKIAHVPLCTRGESLGLRLFKVHHILIHLVISLSFMAPFSLS